MRFARGTRGARRFRRSPRLARGMRTARQLAAPVLQRRFFDFSFGREGNLDELEAGAIGTLEEVSGGAREVEDSPHAEAFAESVEDGAEI